LRVQVLFLGTRVVVGWSAVSAGVQFIPILADVTSSIDFDGFAEGWDFHAFSVFDQLILVGSDTSQAVIVSSEVCTSFYGFVATVVLESVAKRTGNANLGISDCDDFGANEGTWGSLRGFGAIDTSNALVAGQLIIVIDVAAGDNK
jgi:hypothetical protein